MLWASICEAAATTLVCLGLREHTEDRRAVLEWEKVDIICGVQNLSQRVRRGEARCRLCRTVACTPARTGEQGFR